MEDILHKIVDGEYEIQPDIAVALDGGTVSFMVKNVSGETEVLYLDRRIKTETKDVFYKGNYPGREGSVRVGKNDTLVARIEAALKSGASD